MPGALVTGQSWMCPVCGYAADAAEGVCRDCHFIRPEPEDLEDLRQLIGTCESTLGPRLAGRLRGELPFLPAPVVTRLIGELRSHVLTELTRLGEELGGD